MERATLWAWYKRGESDSRRNRNALMYPSSRGHVVFDIVPPDSWEYTDEETLVIARCYYAGFLELPFPKEYIK
jgi:hypothetical protein